MRMCHTEAMKEIRELEERKARLLDKERMESEVSYKEGEEKILPDYSYEQTRRELDELDGKIRAIRTILAKSNCNTVLEDFGISIGEGLVMLAQMNNAFCQLARLAEKQQISRRITVGGVLEYSECVYDVKQATADLEALRKRISALQIAIDRANLTTMVEI